MKDFHQWLETKGYKIPVIDEQPEKVSDDKVKLETGAGRRQASRFNELPPAAGRAQYPDAYFRAPSADAVTYQSMRKGKE